jgi:hypothetical protein
MSAGTHARSTTKIGSNNSLYHHNHFTEQLMGTFRKSLRESDLNQEPSSLLIQRLKNYASLLPAKIHTKIHKRNCTQEQGIEQLVLCSQAQPNCPAAAREGQAKG